MLPTFGLTGVFEARFKRRDKANPWAPVHEEDPKGTLKEAR